MKELLGNSSSLWKVFFFLFIDIVYKLCIKIVLSTYRPIEKSIEYNAGIKHKFSVSESPVTVPDKLLKSKDLR